MPDSTGGVRAATGSGGEPPELWSRSPLPLGEWSCRSDLFKLDVDLVFYDATTAWFECDDEDVCP